ncbi:hypothetical protein ACKKBF_B04860 [Auxenochlorella protothecoides x Auxenochlorella symbiontica]
MDVHVDGKAVFAAVSGILGGAARACSRDPRPAQRTIRVDVTCSTNPDCTVFRVADDGPGMPEAPDSMTHLMASLTSALEDGSQSTYKLQLRSTTCNQSVIATYQRERLAGIWYPTIGPELAPKHQAFSGTDVSLSIAGRLDRQVVQDLSQRLKGYVVLTAAITPRAMFKFSVEQPDEPLRRWVSPFENKDVTSAQEALRAGLTQWASLSTTSPATQTAPPGIGIGHAASRAARWHAYAGVVLRHGAGPTGQQAGPAARVDIHAYLEHEATDPSQAAHDALAGLDWAEFGLRHDASGPVPTLHDETGMPGPLRSCVVVLHLAPARTAGQTPKPLAPRAQAMLMRAATTSALLELKAADPARLRSRREQSLARALPCLAGALVDLARQGEGGGGLLAHACALFGGCREAELEGRLVGALQAAVRRGRASRRLELGLAAEE